MKSFGISKILILLQIWTVFLGLLALFGKLGDLSMVQLFMVGTGGFFLSYLLTYLLFMGRR